ncbi:hypothetical protein DFJ77DRAFT_518059 [Powellomyces hirtus]|nr:hypothetical protein DFJ77DRAFT_518059 [Powellomyces hirtus]
MIRILQSLRAAWPEFSPSEDHSAKTSSVTRSLQLKWIWATPTLRDGSSPVWQQRASSKPYLISNTGSGSSAIAFPDSSMEVSYVDQNTAVKDAHLNESPRIIALLRAVCSVQIQMGNVEWHAVMSCRAWGTFILNCGISLFHVNPESGNGDQWEAVVERMLDLWDSTLSVTASHFKQRQGSMSYPWLQEVPKPVTDRKYQYVNVSSAMLRIVQQVIGSYEHHMAGIFQSSPAAEIFVHGPVEGLLNRVLRGSLGIDGFIFKYLNSNLPQCLVARHICFVNARLLSHPACHRPSCPGWLPALSATSYRLSGSSLRLTSPVCDLFKIRHLRRERFRHH